MQEMIWVTKDGRRIAVCDMTTDHIVNCIRMIESPENTKGWRRRYLDRLNLELDIRCYGLTSRRTR